MDPQLCYFFDASLQLLLQLVRVAGKGKTWCLRRALLWSKVDFHATPLAAAEQVKERTERGVLYSWRLPSHPTPTSPWRSVNCCCFLTRCAPPTWAGSVSAHFSLGRTHRLSDYSSKYLFPSRCHVNRTFSLFFMSLALRSTFKYSSQSSHSDSGETSWVRSWLGKLLQLSVNQEEKEY